MLDTRPHEATAFSTLAKFDPITQRKRQAHAGVTRSYPECVIVKPDVLRQCPRNLPRSRGDAHLSTRATRHHPDLPCAGVSSWRCDRSEEAEPERKLRVVSGGPNWI